MSKQRRRDTTLTIRLTKAEKERIERNAKRAGRSITDYLVLLSLETPIHVAEDVKPLLIELKRIGNNLNQITAKINAGAFRSYNFEDMIDGQKKIYEQLLGHCEERIMATVSFIPESHQSISAMKAVIEYCLQQKKVADEDSGRRLGERCKLQRRKCFYGIYGDQDCTSQKRRNEFLSLCAVFFAERKRDRRAGTRNRFGVCEKAWPGHEVLVTTHTDAAHLHNHFVHQLRALRKRKEAPPKPRHADKTARTQRRHLSAAWAERSRAV